MRPKEACPLLQKSRSRLQSFPLQMQFDTSCRPPLPQSPMPTRWSRMRNGSWRVSRATRGRDVPSRGYSLSPINIYIYIYIIFLTHFFFHGFFSQLPELCGSDSRGIHRRSSRRPHHRPRWRHPRGGQERRRPGAAAHAPCGSGARARKTSGWWPLGLKELAVFCFAGWWVWLSSVPEEIQDSQVWCWKKWIVGFLLYLLLITNYYYYWICPFPNNPNLFLLLII